MNNFYEKAIYKSENNSASSGSMAINASATSRERESTIAGSLPKCAPADGLKPEEITTTHDEHLISFLSETELLFQLTLFLISWYKDNAWDETLYSMKTPTVILISLLATPVLHAQQQGAPVNSQPLATMHFSGRGGIATIGTAMTFNVSYFGFGSSLLFANVVWTPGMVGQSFYDTTGSEAGFGNFVSLLTDGANETVGYTDNLVPHGGGDGLSAPEPIAFATHPSGWNGIDLQGYSITAVGLTMNQLSIVSPGGNPNGNGNWTDFSYDATLTIYTAPEPASLFPIAIVCFCGARSWQRRHSRPGSKL